MGLSQFISGEWIKNGSYPKVSQISVYKRTKNQMKRIFMNLDKVQKISYQRRLCRKAPCGNEMSRHLPLMPGILRQMRFRRLIRFRVNEILGFSHPRSLNFYVTELMCFSLIVLIKTHLP